MNYEYRILLDNATERVILVYADDVCEYDNEVRFYQKEEIVAVFYIKNIVGWYKGTLRCDEGTERIRENDTQGKIL